MNGGGPIALAIQRPVTVLVGVILIVMFGLLSVRGIPIQLTPDIAVPTLSVSTNWAGAAPVDVERDILEQQEEFLRSAPGLERMVSTAERGRASITLEFEVGTDIDQATVQVSNRLSQVPSYPDNVDEPVIRGGDESGPPMAVILIQDPEFGPVGQYRTWVDQEIVPMIERIPGVAGVRHFGGRDQQVRVVFEPAQLAARGITVADLSSAVRDELRDISGGDLTMGKRSFVVRTIVAPPEPESFERIVVATSPDGTVTRLGDVADVGVGLAKRTSHVVGDGKESLALLVSREAGSNVLAVTEQISDVVDELQEQRLAPLGLDMRIASDQTGYIRGALRLVQQNLGLGAIFAVVVLLVFLRSVRAAGVVAVAIPICVMGTILGMSLFGRTANVVSLAGMAFAIGMVVDNAIVVLENIDVWRRENPDVKNAAFEGAKEVWGAILASTLTTAAVFIPIIGWQNEVGEILRDIAVAISVAVLLSLIVSVIVIPSFSAQVLRPKAELEATTPAASASRVLGFGEGVRDWIGDGVRNITQSRARSVAVATIAMVGSVATVMLLLPPMEYLPTGNRNFFFGIMVPPPGYSVEEIMDVGDHVQGRFNEHLQVEKDGVPAIHRSFFVARGGQAFMGGEAEDPDRIGELIQFVRGVQAEVPGMFGVASQASLFGRGVGASRGVEVEISGADYEGLTAAGGALMRALNEAIPGSQIRPVPSLDAGAPELSIEVRREQAAQVGIGGAELGIAVDALVDGRKVGEYGREGEAQIDVVVVGRGGDEIDPASLLASPIATRTGQVVPLSAVAFAEEELSPQTIQRIERRRAISLVVSPPEEVALEEAMRRIREDVLPNVALPEGVRVELSGTAGRLQEAQAQFGYTLLLAVVISFLLMAALFEDFLAPLVILVSVPLAGAGGIAGLRLVDATMGSQPLDMMTSLGFVILIGVVVNNPILVVDGALSRIRAGYDLSEALAEAVERRVRPIFMSSLTTLAGLMPLVLFPGSGSELYRGVGAVVLGGLAVATVLTLFVVPAVFALVWRFRMPAPKTPVLVSPEQPGEQVG